MFGTSLTLKYFVVAKYLGADIRSSIQNGQIVDGNITFDLQLLQVIFNLLAPLEPLKFKYSDMTAFNKCWCILERHELTWQRSANKN